MLTVSHLRKEYATVVAVDDVSLNVKPGEVFGLLGPNGAGKTTTIRMILNIIAPDSGEVRINGRTFNDQTRNLVGYLPEERGLYRKNKLLNTILYFASLRGIQAPEAKRRAYDWLKRFDLLSYHDRKVEELSKGNQQKVQFIISILHDPQLVILDEPFSGLDPLNQILLKDILLELKQRGKGIIFSTHQMDQAEKLCDNICLINRGKVVLEGELREVKKRYGKNSVHIEFDGDGSFLSTLPAVKKAQVYENYAEIVIEDHAAPKQLLAAVAPKLDIRKFEYVEPSLNSIFIDVVGGSSSIEEPLPVQSPRQTTSSGIHQNKKVKQDLLRLIIVSTVTIALVVAFFVKGDMNWTSPALFLLVSILSLLKYMKTRKNALAETRRQHIEGAGDAR